MPCGKKAKPSRQVPTRKPKKQFSFIENYDNIIVDKCDLSKRKPKIE